MSILPEFAIASKCKIEFVDPPRAKSVTIAFLIESRVMMSEGFMPFSTSSTIFMPDSKAICFFFEETAEAVAQKGRLIPITSVRQAMVFAV